MEGEKMVNWKWVYNTKCTFEGVLECHKDLLEEKGFSQ
jgi:hypothetical protein